MAIADNLGLRAGQAEKVEVRLRELHRRSLGVADDARVPLLSGDHFHRPG
jgi:predicted protein tyrosine phosphatase